MHKSDIQDPTFTFRFKRNCSQVEITHVHASTSTALAIYASTAQSSQSWIDSFTLPPQSDSSSSPSSSLSKTPGSLAFFTPSGGLKSSTICATRRDWTMPVGKGIDYHHSSSLIIRDVATGKSILEIKDAQAGVICWSPDGRFLAASEQQQQQHSNTTSSSSNHRVGVWDSQTGGRVGRVLGHIDVVTHAVLVQHYYYCSDSASSPLLVVVTASKDGTLRVTNLMTGRTVARMEVGSRNPRLLSATRDGALVVSVWGSEVYVWSPWGGEVRSYELGRVRGREGWPVCVSEDCRWMVCRTEEGFDVMEVSSGRVVFECLRWDGDVITSGAFSPDSKVLVLGRLDGVVEVWDVHH